MPSCDYLTLDRNTCAGCVHFLGLLSLSNQGVERKITSFQWVTEAYRSGGSVGALF